MMNILKIIAIKINLFNQLEKDCKTYKKFADFYFDILQIILDDEEYNNRTYNIELELNQLNNCNTHLRIELLNQMIHKKYFNIHRNPKNKKQSNIGFISHKEYEEFKYNYLSKLNYSRNTKNSTRLIEIFSALALILCH